MEACWHVNYEKFGSSVTDDAQISILFACIFRMQFNGRVALVGKSGRGLSFCRGRADGTFAA